MIRFVALLICIALLIGCRPGSKRNDEERAVQQELESLEQESTEHNDPDGAFGAKDYATDAREAANQDTQQLKSAVEEIDE